MARAGPKTVRFSQVVERSGQPHVHTLWVPPEKDPEFRRAQQSHRVMTVQPGASGKADVGIVGADTGRTASGQFLIFPKSLKRFENARVIGIKFDLVKQPKLAALAERIPGPPSPAAQRAAQRAAASRQRQAEAEGKEPKDAPNVVPFEHATAPTPEPRSPPPRSHSPPESQAAAGRKTGAAPKPAAAKPAPADSALLKAVRAAMKDLQQGKSVAAYQRLERAVQPFEKS